MTILVVSPLAGLALALADVPDPVFSQSLAGPGVAVKPDPAPAEVVAPIDGTVVTLRPHAFVLSGAAGVGILVHLGIDTARLDGVAATPCLEEGSAVYVGQPVLRWDPARVEQHGRSPVCPVIALDAGPDAVFDRCEVGHVDVGAPVFALS